MKILMPRNVFAKLLSYVLPEEIQKNIQYKEASVLSTELENGDADLAVIPSMDLIKHEEFFVSSKFAISCDGILSNSYLFFKPGQKSISDLYVIGDVSLNEIVLSKILFQEKYSSDVKIHLGTENSFSEDKNFLVSGDKNYDNIDLSKGLSFADELSTLLFLPYVNFIIASRYDKKIIQFNSLVNNIDETIENNLNIYLPLTGINVDSQNFIKENFNSVFFELTETEKEALNELIRLPYYHGISDGIVDVKFV